MNRVGRTAAMVAAAGAALGLAACTPHHSAAKLQNSPQTKEAQAIVNQCLSAHPVTSKAAFQSFEQCVVPSGHTAAFQQCAESNLATILFSKSARQQWETVTLPNCVVKYR